MSRILGERTTPRPRTATGRSYTEEEEARLRMLVHRARTALVPPPGSEAPSREDS